MSMSSLIPFKSQVGPKCILIIWDHFIVIRKYLAEIIKMLLNFLEVKMLTL